METIYFCMGKPKINIPQPTPLKSANLPPGTGLCSNSRGYTGRNLLDMIRILHGDAVFDSAGLPCMAGLDHIPGDYIAPGLVPGVVKIVLGTGGVTPAESVTD